MPTRVRFGINNKLIPFWRDSVGEPNDLEAMRLRVLDKHMRLRGEHSQVLRGHEALQAGAQRVLCKLRISGPVAEKLTKEFIDDLIWDLEAALEQSKG